MGGISVRIRRVDAGQVEAGVDLLEGLFEESSDGDAYESELDSDILCDLESEWHVVNISLTGEIYPANGVPSWVVLGGVHIATFDDPAGVLIWLDADSVRKVSEYLEDGNSENGRADRRDRLGGMVEELRVTDGDAAADEFLDIIADGSEIYMDGLVRLYGLAASRSQAVVKRVYTA